MLIVKNLLRDLVIQLLKLVNTVVFYLEEYFIYSKATGDTGKYIFSQETYLFDNSIKQWKKLECLGSAPSPRAAHAATTIEKN